MNIFKKLGAAGLAVALTLAGQNAYARCIDPITNTVDTVADCLFANGGATDDCRVAIGIDMDGAGTPPADPKKIYCTDGAACDADGAVNGVCTFRVGVCLNVPNAGCDVDTVTASLIKKPSVKDGNDAIKRPRAAYNRFALNDALAGILPAAGQTCTDADLPVKVDLKSKDGLCSDTGDKCLSDLDCTTSDTDSCVPTVKKNKANVEVNVTDSVDDYSAKFKLNCDPAIGTFSNGAEAVVAAAPDLIGGPLAIGKLGDTVIRNGNLRAVVRKAGREHSFGILHGGQIIDADLVRSDPSEDRDSWGGWQPQINISSTQGTDTVAIDDNGSSAAHTAIVTSSGPDDLYDSIKGDVIILSNAPLNIPASAIDINLPVDVETHFILNPYSNAIQVATTVINNTGAALPYYMGDILIPDGQVEPFGPGQGYGETQLRNGAISGSGGQPLDYLAFQGRMDAAGVAYGVVFQPTNAASRSTLNIGCFTQSGFYACVTGQNLFDVLLKGPTIKPPGTFNIPASGERTNRRWFVVGSTVADVTKFRTQLFDEPKAALQGLVTSNGAPAANAHVALLNDNANFENPPNCPAATNCTNVFSSTLTDEHGFYRFVVPEGDYRVAVRKAGTPYEGSASTPPETAVVLSEKKTTLLDVALPGTAQLVVNADDQGGNPIAAKVSIVGVPVSPDPLNSENIGIVGFNFVGRYFGFDFEEKGDIFGLVDDRFTDHLTGTTGSFDLEPGTYHVVVSHGYEYDVYNTQITIAAGANPPVNAVVNKVVDTIGFASIDTHVHMIESLDSAVSNERRILSMIAEGVDFFANTDHDFMHDLTDDIAGMGATGLVANSPSTETTTSHYGHFNEWPQTVDPLQYDGGAEDWSFHLGEVNGLTYPSDGAYDRLPGEIFGDFNPVTQVIQINHFNSGTLGHFNSLGIDTEQVPPDSSNQIYRCVGGTSVGLPCQIKICLGGGNDGASCTLPGDCPGGTCGAGTTCTGGTCTATGLNLSSYLRMDPAVVNLFDDGFTALEVWIEAGRGQTELLLGENMGDWFNMLNQGIFKAGVADSDTHTNFIVQAGGPRTWVASSSDNPATISPAELAVNTNAMRGIGSNGPFMRVELENGTAQIASHAIGDSRTVVATAGALANNINVHIEAPTWAQYDTIDVYINSTPTCISEWTFFGLVNPSACDTVAPTMTFTKDDADPGTDPDEFTVSSILGVSGFGSRQVSDLSIPVTVAADSWVVVVVRGTDGVSAPLFPMQPQDLDDSVNATLADLTDSNGPLPWNLGELGALALAFSNPLWFDDPAGDNFCHGGTACPGM